jgi:hypothetical protein
MNPIYWIMENLYKKLYIKSGAKNFNEYIKFINSIYSNNKIFSKEEKEKNNSIDIK